MLYRFAALNVEMVPLYPLLLKRAELYRLPPSAESTAPDIVIDIPAEIRADYEASLPQLSAEESEYLLYGTVFYNRLVSYNGILLHASAVALDGHAYLFSANPGVGKSTHTALWRAEFPDAFIINDDKPALRCINNVFYCCGTPFSGKNDISRDVMLPVAGIAFVSRGNENYIERIAPDVSLPLFMEQTHRCFDAKKADVFLSILSNLLSAVPVYSLVCNRNPQAARIALEAMRPQD